LALPPSAQPCCRALKNSVDASVINQYRFLWRIPRNRTPNHKLALTVGLQIVSNCPKWPPNNCAMITQQGLLHGGPGPLSRPVRTDSTTPSTRGKAVALLHRSAAEPGADGLGLRRTAAKKRPRTTLNKADPLRFAGRKLAERAGDTTDDLGGPPFR